MLRPPNQISVDQNFGTFSCEPCNRDFDKVESLVQHARRTAIHTHTWCDLCQWLFIDGHARKGHGVVAHHGYRVCGEKLDSENDLIMVRDSSRLDYRVPHS